MLRTTLCSLIGAGAAFLVGFVVVQVMGGRESASDTTAVSLFFGGLLAVGGAIAGAVVGVAGQLREFRETRGRTEK